MLSLESLASELIELLVTCGIYYIDYVGGENVENLSSGFYDTIFSDYSFCFSFLHEISFSCFLKSQNSLFTILCDNLVYLFTGSWTRQAGHLHQVCSQRRSRRCGKRFSKPATILLFLFYIFYLGKILIFLESLFKKVMKVKEL